MALRDDFASTQPGTAVTVDVLKNDEFSDASEPSVETAEPPDNGTIAVTRAGVIQYEPDEGFTGEDSFVYRLANGSGDTETAEVFVNVWPSTNEPPTAEDDLFTAYSDTPRRLDVVANDSDPDAETGVELHFDDVGQPDHSELDISPVLSNLTYTPDRGFTGQDSFTYTLEDAQGATDSATVEIDVLDGSTEAWNLWDLPGEAQISALYVGILGRAPDSDGLTYWTDRYEGARSDGKPAAETIGEIAFGIYLSPEAQQRHAGVVLPDPDPDAYEAFTEDVFTNLFTRVPAEVGPSTPGKGLDGRAQDLENAIDQGRSGGDVIVDMISATTNGTTGAVQIDVDTLRNRVEVAEAYAETVDESAFDADESARIIGTVDRTDQSLQAALSEIEALG